MKILINDCDIEEYHLNKHIIFKYFELQGVSVEYDAKTNTYLRNGEDFNWMDIERNDPNLIKAFEKISEEGNLLDESLKVIEIPDGIPWTVQQNGAYEWVAEKHRTWHYVENSVNNKKGFLVIKLLKTISFGIRDAILAIFGNNINKEHVK